MNQLIILARVCLINYGYKTGWNNSEFISGGGGDSTCDFRFEKSLDML